MFHHAFRRAVLALLTFGVAACAGNDPTSPRSVARRLAPASASHDVLTPADSALCRSGYSLAEGRVCP